MENTGPLEGPCIFIRKTQFIQEQTTIPAVKQQRASVECLANCPEECPKKKNRNDITMLCFRIRGHNERRKQAAGGDA